VNPNRLLGAEVSYYTGKVRAYLRYKHIPFVEVAATRDLYRDVIVPRTGVRFIPVLISDDDVAVQDSTAIIDFLEQRYPDRGIYPDRAVQRLCALLLEVYADEWLLLPAMHYRWNIPENRAFAIAEFGRLSVPEASPADQLAIGEKLARPFAGALPALGVSPATAPAIEESYRELLSDFDRHLQGHAYTLGARPSIGDFALFGPLYAHLYRDPASGRLMREVASRVSSWVERMLTPTGPAESFLPSDAVPRTLEPLLARMFIEFGPVLASTMRAIERFDPESPDSPLPRALGTHQFQLRGAVGERAIYPFNVWRWQRAHDHYHALEEIDRSRADALLERIGGRELLQTPIARRLERRNNRLFLAPAA
jgi:glutathione S-transferase